MQNLSSITNSAPHRIKHFRNKLIAGILISVPLVVTLTVLKIAYSTINNFSSPIFHSLGVHFPGVGVVTTLLLLLGLGFMATNVIGRNIIEKFEAIILKIPVVAHLYGGVKQAIESVRNIKMSSNFKRVAYVPYPSSGCYLIGFVTGTLYDETLGYEMTAVFLPTTPNPFTGYMVFIESSRVIESSLTLEQATKAVVSAGLVSPAKPFPASLGVHHSPNGEVYGKKGPSVPSISST
ncbi:MAG: DUF502 domain-containing protein [Candidatus Xiphinematobacter sp.]|nr:MAG: DUF502 domain-containing protein [Candidatus Xiphinematobacter sp.]QQY10605.1 MAG: DUF502 domain-containing protein [Candidatus Xiphinematobacter sp.]QQY11344.1 MAG: DUF502 domain-containing protein [Candidatus Xiphinematobacter sp.]